jgi:hypothetical protein
MRRALAMPVGGVVLSAVVGVLAGCGSASTMTHAAATIPAATQLPPVATTTPTTTTPTTTTPTTTTTTTTPTTTATSSTPTTTATSSTPTTTNARPPAAPSAGSTNAAVDAVTDDGGVLTLDDGSVYSVDGGDQSTVSSWSQGDPVSVSDSNDAIFNSSTGDKVSVTYVDDSSAAHAYAGVGSSISAKSDDGSIIVLDDGSIWIVAPYDRSTSGPWVDGTSITVNDSGATDQLVDTDDQETVDANYIGQE